MTSVQPHDTVLGMGVPVVRVDRPMARRAVELGERVAVVAALASTVEPSRHVLLDEAARADRDVHIDTHVVDDAWNAFLAGDLDAYERQVADACRAVAARADVIVLAQASMAGAIGRLADLDVPVLASPALAVEFLTGECGAWGGL